MDATTTHEMGWLWRIVSVMVGFGIAITGFALIMSAILSFIGLPLLIFCLALMQSAEQR